MKAPVLCAAPTSWSGHSTSLACDAVTITRWFSARPRNRDSATTSLDTIGACSAATTGITVGHAAKVRAAAPNCTEDGPTALGHLLPIFTPCDAHLSAQKVLKLVKEDRGRHRQVLDPASSYAEPVTSYSSLKCSRCCGWEARRRVDYGKPFAAVVAPQSARQVIRFAYICCLIGNASAWSLKDGP